MTEVHTPKSGPHVPEPTDAEVTETIQRTKAQHGVTLSRDDATRVAKLRKELGWWLHVDQKSDKPKPITEEIAQEAQAHLEQSNDTQVSLEEAALRAERSVLVTSQSEKDRIAQQIRDIIKNASDTSDQS